MTRAARRLVGCLLELFGKCVERFSSSARLSHTSCLRECDRLKEMFDEAALTWENFRARVEESVVSPDLCQCLVIIQSAAFAHLKIDG